MKRSSTFSLCFNRRLTLPTPLFIFLTGLVLLSGIFCQKRSVSQEKVVVRVGKRFVTLKEFRNLYESDPAFPGYQKGPRGLEEYAEKIVAQALAEKLAAQAGLLEKPEFKRLLDYERNQEIIRLFYRKQVAQKARVSEAELREAFRKNAVKLRVKNLFARDKSEAERLYRSLESGVPFDTLAKRVNALHRQDVGSADLGEVSWGSMEAVLEDTIYRLPPGAYSKPVHSRWGYHILLVTDRCEQIILTEDEFRLKKDQLFRKVKRRKEEIAAAAYLKQFLDPFQIRVRSDAFRKIATLLKISAESRRNRKIFSPPIFTDARIGEFRNRLKSDLDQPFMTSTHAVWSIGDFLKKVSQLPPAHRPVPGSLNKFKNDIGMMIRDEFLLSEAHRRGVDKSVSVDSLLHRVTGKLSYQYYFQEFFRSFEVSAKVTDYFRNRFFAAEMPPTAAQYGILPEMRCPEDYRYYHASRKLYEWLLSKFPSAKIEMNQSLLSTEAQRIDWHHPMRMFVVRR